MKLIPFGKIILKSELSKENVLHNLKKIISNELLVMSKLINPDYSKEYLGKIYENGFHLSRIKYNRAEVRPQIIGEIYNDNKYTIIEIVFKLRRYEILFMHISYILYIIILLVNLMLGSFELEQVLFLTVLSVLMIIQYFYVSLNFRIEINRFINELDRLIECECIDSL